MTPEGRKYIMARLTDAPDIHALRRVWESISVEYRNDREIRALKDDLRARMEGVGDA